MLNKKDLTLISSLFVIATLLLYSTGFVLAKNEDHSPNSHSLEPHGNSDNQHVLLKSNNNKVEVSEVDNEGNENEHGNKPQEYEEVQFVASTSADTSDQTSTDEAVTVKANGNASVVIRNKLETQTNFPLMVNLETNELIVNTPKGQKIVTVLPDAAVKHMLAANVLDQIGGKGGLTWLAAQPTPTSTSSATPTLEVSGTPTESGTLSPTEAVSGPPSAAPETTASSPLKLIMTDDGTLAYEIEGYKTKKLLGLFKVKLHRFAYVSPETGQLINVKQDFLTTILDRLSI